MTDLSPTLGLLWLASPALPVGGFSYSEGLEAAVEAGTVGGESDAVRWLLSALELNQARSELPAVAAAWRAWGAEGRGEGADADAAALQHLNLWVLATRESAELRLQAEQMGRSLTEWLRHTPEGEDARWHMLRGLVPAPTWPVAFGLAGWRTGAALEQVLAASAFGWAENAVQAAMKTIPLGQVAGQRILGRLAAAIPRAVQEALRRTPAQRQAFSPMLAVLSARHEVQYSRLFRS